MTRLRPRTATTLLIGGLAVAFCATASPVFAKPDKFDGENYASGRIPQEIRDNKYPRAYFPGTEKLGKEEMRITACGTGMPNQTPTNAAACFLVELGNGDVSLFDLGTGSTDRLAGLELDYEKLDKVFASHPHTDHVGDVATLWVGGWLSGRYTPLHVTAPRGQARSSAPRPTSATSVMPGSGTSRRARARCPTPAAKSSRTSSTTRRRP
jgi:hypothetical protein